MKSNCLEMHLHIFIILSFTACHIFARPWNADDVERAIDLVPQMSSPLMKTIDSMSVGFVKSFRNMSPTLTPLLSMASLAYIGYVGSVMFQPKLLANFGIPLLDDFDFESRSTRTAESGFIDSLATGFVKDMIARTEAADLLKNTSVVAVRNGIGTLKKTTKFLNLGLDTLSVIVDKLAVALRPECMSRYMCQVGQFTSLHVPAIGPFLRSINTFDLDDYSQALIDGTTVGDCSSVFFECSLDE